MHRSSLVNIDYYTIPLHIMNLCKYLLNENTLLQDTLEKRKEKVIRNPKVQTELLGEWIE